MRQIEALLLSKISDVQSRLDAKLAQVGLPTTSFSKTLSAATAQTVTAVDTATDTASVARTVQAYTMPSSNATATSSNLAAMMMSSIGLSSGSTSSFGLGSSSSNSSNTLAGLLMGNTGSDLGLGGLSGFGELSGSSNMSALSGLQNWYLSKVSELYSVTGTGTGPVPAYEGYIQQAANQYQLDPDLIKSVIRIESNYDPNSVSHKGAVGLMQLMPGTAEYLGVSISYDPQQNIDGGVKYLKELMDRFGDVRLALGAYRSGPGYVGRVLKESGSNDAAFMNLTDGTRNYVEVALGHLRDYKS